ncbi:hypothetical protein A3J78_02160 [Candidatus Beckwithbacteria bacterium RBG_13_35_6]|uniref:N-acetyltransferase domain-containing protein n=1 Tax=Candidatus Beckwithbacteria bacterium RBG_13_35_6 TaxID=1797456 RepID=A0A1F5DCN2_9BACT|nr:MAG: hypothetical protein A3J78_02160 [Candidatus Beckwithbacteria bacterium RBG_13_35_6]
MDIIVEALKLQELDSFWQVFKIVLSKDFPGYSPKVVDYFLNKLYNQASFNYWLNSGYKTVLVAKFGNTIIGFAVIDKPYGGVCFCRWLGILKNFRKKGAGKKIIAAWIQYAKEYGCHKVEVASQPNAKIFYQKCNLDFEGKRKLSYFGIDQYIFGKVISEQNDEVMIRD